MDGWSVKKGRWLTLENSMEFGSEWHKREGRLNNSLRDMVKKESSKIGLNKEDAQDKKKWREGVSSRHESQ